MFCEGTNKLPNAKNRNVLPSKLRPVNLFKNYQHFQFNKNTQKSCIVKKNPLNENVSKLPLTSMCQISEP